MHRYNFLDSEWKLSILGFFRIVSPNEVNRVKTVLLELSCVMYVVFLSIGIYSVDLPSPQKIYLNLKWNILLHCEICMTVRLWIIRKCKCEASFKSLNQTYILIITEYI